MDYNKVQVGDIIFADWGIDVNKDGKIDTIGDGVMSLIMR